MNDKLVQHEMPGDEGRVEYLEPTAVSAIARAEINQQIATAKTYPRNMTDFVRECETLVTNSPAIAAECIYSLPREGKIITGPSVRFAEIVVSMWGNCRIGARVIDEDEHFVTAQGFFHDLERNTAISFEVKRRITKSNGQRYSDDMVAVTAGAACATALRNAGLRGVPKVFWLAAYHAVQNTIKGTQKDFTTRRNALLAHFKDKYAVKPEAICKALDLPGVNDITLEHLEVLHGMATAIKDGESTVESLFGVAPGNGKTAAPETVPAKSADAPAPGKAPISPAAEFRDYAGNKGFNRRSDAAMLRLVNEIKGMEAVPFKKLAEVSEAEWGVLLGQLRQKYEPADAAPSATASDAAETGSLSAEAEIPEEEAPAEPQSADAEAELSAEIAVAIESVDAFVALCNVARKACKSQDRQFYKVSPKGTRWFVDSPILDACGLNPQLGVNLEAEGPARLAEFARGVIEARNAATRRAP
jgi:hypothetical protein